VWAVACQREIKGGIFLRVDLEGSREDLSGAVASYLLYPEGSGRRKIDNTAAVGIPGGSPGEKLWVGSRDFQKYPHIIDFLRFDNLARGLHSGTTGPHRKQRQGIAPSGKHSVAHDSNYSRPTRFCLHARISFRITRQRTCRANQFRLRT
jgi:hypothetical protein